MCLFRMIFTRRALFFIEQWNQKKLGGEREFRKEILK